jgi:hypothetical protein
MLTSTCGRKHRACDAYNECEEDHRDSGSFDKVTFFRARFVSVVIVGDLGSFGQYKPSIYGMTPRITSNEMVP